MRKHHLQPVRVHAPAVLYASCLTLGVCWVTAACSKPYEARGIFSCLAQLLCRVRDEISDLSEKYSAALSEHETSNAVVQVQLWGSILSSQHATVHLLDRRRAYVWCVQPGPSSCLPQCGGMQQNALPVQMRQTALRHGLASPGQEAVGSVWGPLECSVAGNLCSNQRHREQTSRGKSMQGTPVVTLLVAAEGNYAAQPAVCACAGEGCRALSVRQQPKSTIRTSRVYGHTRHRGTGCHRPLFQRFPYRQHTAWCVQRNLKVAQALARDAEKKRAEAVRLAIEFDTAKTAAREAGQVSPSCACLHRPATAHLSLWM